MPSHDHILKLLHRAALSAEDAMDSARRRLRAATGRGEPKHIAAYHGYADASRVRVSGRVLANRPGGGPLDDDRWWDNLVNTWRRWESDEVPGAVVHLRFGEQEQRVVADEEGYYEAQFERTEESHDGLLWLEAEARAGIDGNGVRATHDVLVPSRHAAFGIISDLDDTVVHTGITSLLLAAKLTFLENAKTRKPLDGVAKLYEALQQGKAERRINPLFYISSSPWNLYDLLVDFLRLNEIPPGPLLLRDLGLDATKFIKEKGHGHKQRKAQALLESYPDLPFVLVGDSGQDDPAIYADLAAEHPERILAIYIRDVDPDRETIFDQSADRARDRADALGVPMILAKDSLMITEHAQRIGLIPPSALTDVIEEIDKDRERPETGEQAVKDAVASLGPEA